MANADQPEVPVALPTLPPASDALQPAGGLASTGANVSELIENVSLEPRFWVPLGVTLLGPAALVVSPLWSGVRWLTLALVLFGGFLLLQARTLRLEFAAMDLVVWRGETEIRRFPYQSWISWTLFWPKLPVLFYFREQRSIHFLPVLFDASTLRQQLQQRLSHLASSPTP